MGADEIRLCGNCIEKVLHDTVLSVIF